MIIKNNNKATDVQKNQHVCWEGQKTSRRFYVKKTISYGKWTTHKDPQTIPSISWEGGTTVNCKCWVERNNTIREGFAISTVTEKKYLIPTFSADYDCKLNSTGNPEDGFTFTFGRRDNATSDRIFTGTAQYIEETGRYTITVTVTQTKRDKYVTKLDNANITTDIIPASGGNISSGILTYKKTYNTGETENVTENITFSTVSVASKGTTESGITVVKTIPIAGTTQKQTTIDGVTLQHPSFTIKQAANSRSVKTPESKTTTDVILYVSPTRLYSSGGTVKFSLQRIYTLNKTVYQYTSGSTSGGDSVLNQGPETVNANQTYTITGIPNVSSTTGTSYKIPASTTARTIIFKTTYDGKASNTVTVEQKLDGPNESKPFIYSNLKITTFDYPFDRSGYHFPASGGTIIATTCFLDGTYDWTYTTMENKTVTETISWDYSDLTSSMYSFTPTSVTAPSLGTTSANTDNNYSHIDVIVKNLKHTYNGKQYDVKNSNGDFLTASATTTLTRQRNIIETKDLTDTSLDVDVSPESFTYTGGTATLTSYLLETYDVIWTSGSTSTDNDYTPVTSSTTFTGEYRISGQSTTNTFSFTGSNPVIPNIQSSTSGRTYTFTGSYDGYSDTVTVTQTGNTTLYTVTFYINNEYAEWSNTTNEYITKKFSQDTPYDELKPGATPEWIEGSLIKYEPTGKYSLTTSGSAVTSSQLLKSDINLYVIWTHPYSFIKITFDPNGGTLTSKSGDITTTYPIYDYYPSSSAVSCSPGDTGYNNVPINGNKTFTGWRNNITNQLYNTYPISISTSSWEHNIFTAEYKNMVKILWNANGGRFDGSWSGYTQTIEYGSTVYEYTKKPRKNGYNFDGWSETETGSVVTFPVIAIKDTIYYAIYSIIEYTVTWDTTGGRIDELDSGTFPQIVKYGGNVSFSMYTATKKGYTFVGWNTDKNATTGSTSGTYNVTADITFYAIWSVEIYIVEWDPNGGTINESTNSILQDVNYESTVSFSTYTPTREGYTFVGWNTDKNATTGSKYGYSSPIRSNTIFYAIWYIIEYIVTWNAGRNGGSLTNGQSSAQQVVSHGDIVSFTQYTASKTGYTFKGWNMDKDATTGSTSGNSSSITSNTTFYAIFKINEYTITWNANSGLWDDNSTIKTEVKTYNYNIYGYTLSQNPHKESTIESTGWSLSGWSKTQTGTIVTFPVKLTENITFYAIWKLTCAVWWFSNDGTFLSGSSTGKADSDVVDYGDTVNFADSVTKYSPTREGYTFVGWNTDRYATTGSLSGNSDPITAHTDFYAIWKSNTNTFTLTLKLGGGNINGNTSDIIDTLEE